MKLNKLFFKRTYAYSCTGDKNNIGSNNGNYEDRCSVTITRIGSNTYEVEEYFYDTGMGDIKQYDEDGENISILHGLKAVYAFLDDWFALEQAYYEED